MSISAVMNCESCDDTEMNFSRVEFLLRECGCVCFVDYFSPLFFLVNGKLNNVQIFPFIFLVKFIPQSIVCLITSAFQFQSVCPPRGSRLSLFIPFVLVTFKKLTFFLRTIFRLSNFSNLYSHEWIHIEGKQLSQEQIFSDLFLFFMRDFTARLR